MNRGSKAVNNGMPSLAPVGPRVIAAQVRIDQRDLGPRDMVDVQSFLWVQGSAEYDE